MSKQLSSLALAVAALVVATALPSSAAAGPLVYRKATTTIPAYSHEGVGRPCPFGSEVTGGGGALLGADSPDSQLVELTPYDATGSPGGPRDGYLAGGYNGAEVERQVKTIAICLRRGTARLAPAVASTQIPADQVQASVAAVCAPGSDAIGGGGGLNGTFGPTTRLLQTGPTQVADGEPNNDAWTTTARRPLNGEPRTIWAQAACLDTGARELAQRTAGKFVASGQTATLSVRCPGRFQVSGGGVGGGLVSISSLIPFDGPDRRRVPDDGMRARVANYVVGAQDVYLTATCLR